MLTRLIKLFWREADMHIGGRANPYIKRWYLIPRNRWLNVYLHQFLRDDDDRALHDHPWRSVSLVLWAAAGRMLDGREWNEFPVLAETATNTRG